MRNSQLLFIQVHLYNKYYVKFHVRVGQNNTISCHTVAYHITSYHIIISYCIISISYRIIPSKLYIGVYIVYLQLYSVRVLLCITYYCAVIYMVYEYVQLPTAASQLLHCSFGSLFWCAASHALHAAKIDVAGLKMLKSLTATQLQHLSSVFRPGVVISMSMAAES